MCVNYCHAYVVPEVAVARMPSNGPEPLFLVGAGFNADARALAGSIRGRSIYIGEYEIDCGYPLVADLPQICFPDVTPLVRADEVEDRLADALDSRERDPLERLCMTLMKADYYIGPRLLTSRENAYGRLIADFPGSSFLSFNYDSFLEFGLFRAGRWSPHDGYGVPVVVDLGFTARPYEVRSSRNLVLHLHGTLMVYTQHFTFRSPDDTGIQWMKEFDPPRFMFDPDSLGNLFYPFTRVVGGLGYNPDITERVIAPVPEKTKGLRQEFVASVRSRALDLLRQHPIVVSIGYSFGENDRDSYEELLDAMSGNESARVVLVVPEAVDVAVRLRERFPRVTWDAQPMTFAGWAAKGFPGIATGTSEVRHPIRSIGASGGVGAPPRAHDGAAPAQSIPTDDPSRS